ncbi:MAG: S41 family peptidase, partial [Chitinophagales bacterium]
INVDSIVDDFVSAYLNDPETIDELFKKLDPHSSYIHKEDLSSFNEELDGNFDGVGIEFNILDDTILVVAALSGGPSEKLGIKAGDKIIMIDDSLVAGNGVTNEKVISKLRGKKGTKVNVKIRRNGEKNLLDFNIIRDVIPVTSIDANYMVDEETGYIKVNKFANETPLEFADALQGLVNQGMKNLILDLRGNPGGYLRGAVELADEFLSGTPLIVYTEGRAVGKDEYRAGKNGLFENGNLVVLVNEFSASASEILAGALQDNKRATIIGRRSFGKGLVQQVYDLSDSSAIRLTIARYYTPNGKSIQRPYDEGVDAYYDQYISIIQNGGELPDSLKNNKNMDWGIHPDIHVPIDSSPVNKTLNYLFNRSIIQEFSYSVYSENPQSFSKFNDLKNFTENYVISDELFNRFTKYAISHDPDKSVSEAEINAARPKIEIAIKAFIARQKWGNNGYYAFINLIDDTYLKAIEHISRKY